jgi:hypothetical protein
LRPEVLEILTLIGSFDRILGTGHLSPEESCVLIDAARDAGVGKILVTHPEWGPTFYSVELQRRLAVGGRVFFERCFVSTTHRCGSVPFARIEQAIADVGIQTTVLATDLGQPDTPPPAEGLRQYVERLTAAGFSPCDLRRMMRDTPRALLGLG